MRLWKWKSALPPKKKDWKNGQCQIGLFMRLPSGATIEASVNRSNDDTMIAAGHLLTLLTSTLEGK